MDYGPNKTLDSQASGQDSFSISAVNGVALDAACDSTLSLPPHINTDTQTGFYNSGSIGTSLPTTNQGFQDPVDFLSEELMPWNYELRSDNLTDTSHELEPIGVQVMDSAEAKLDLFTKY